MVARLSTDAGRDYRLALSERTCRSDSTVTTQALPLDPYEHDDTPTGHSYAAAWIALIGFFALDVLIAVQIGALHHFFG
ncbi:hypothetical protein RT21_19995 [Pseudomonas sp. 10B238]|nr:hypothetical protein RT21_19995 [Pseudomonas sp. 10B238]